MSSPAFRALKETFSCKITVLTSSMAKAAARLIPYIDDVIVYDLPWVKVDQPLVADDFFDIIKVIKGKAFDAAIIFTVYSQNPLPAAMITYLSGIPVRLAYCRENPYALLTHWVPEKEPYTLLRHQVRRDLDLVATIGATTVDESLALTVSAEVLPAVIRKLKEAGIDPSRPWIILHAPVSEKKREYPTGNWIEAGKKLATGCGLQLLLTGTGSEKTLTDRIAEGIGDGAFSIAGLFNLEEFVSLIQHAALVISVNTGTVHIAAAMQTPVVVLYALTNPQHTPWKVARRILPFDVPGEMRSKNEVITFVHNNVFSKDVPMVTPDKIVKAAMSLLSGSLRTGTDNRKILQKQPAGHSC